MTTADALSIEVLVDWLARFAARVARDRVELTELDTAIGDGDHGANLARGTAAVADRSEHGDTVEAEAKSIGMTLVTTVGGASGPLFGTFFLRFGVAAGPVTSLDTRAFALALRAGLDGVVERGRAERGDKTLVDALAPAVDAFEERAAAGDDLDSCASAAREAARRGRDETAPLLARKGRASYLGERSIGHVDPGAQSTTYLFDSLVEAIRDDA